MKNIYKRPIIILRKQIKGEHSIEELSYRLANYFNLDVICVPFQSTKIVNLIKNIKFIKTLSAPTYLITSPTEAYLLPFLHGKRIITYHDIGTLLSSRNLFYKLFKILIYLIPSLLFANCITFVSEQTKKEYKDFFHIKDNKRLYVIYNPYNPIFNTGIKKQKNEIFTILHIGTAVRKNLKNVLLAIKDLNVKIIIVGILNEEQKRIIQQNALNYENYFDISTEELVSYYQKCDLITFPSSYEGFGMPVIEANAARVPIIAGDIEILHEVANNAALFVDGTNIIDIKNGIKKIMDSTELRNELINEGIKNCQRFSEQEIYNQYKAIIL